MHPRTLALALAVVILLAFKVFAADGPGTGNTFMPYTGRLENGGAGVTGTANFRVGLFNSNAANVASCLASDPITACGTWADEFLATPVAGGAFVLGLGTNRPLPDTVFVANPTLYLGVAVAPSGSSSYVVLNNLQRLGSVPYATRTERADSLVVSRDANVGGKLAVGLAAPQRAVDIQNGELRVVASHNNATYDLAQFYANNGTQGLGLGYDTLAAVGSLADQDLHLLPRGLGVLQADGPTHVNGELLAQATRTEGTTSATYLTSKRRLLFIASYSGGDPVRSYTPISQATLVNYCGDEDGCRVTVRMRNWGAGAGSRTATSISFHFNYGESLAGQAWWRREALPASPNAAMLWGNEVGQDGSGVQDAVAVNHDCYFTDGEYVAGSPSVFDVPGLGMGLLNYNRSGGVYAPTCELIIDD